MNDKFCKIFREGEERKEVYTWKLQILEWSNYAALASNPSYDNIITSKYFSSDEKVDDRMLNRQQCKNMSYLFTNVSSSVYYKFQIVFAKHRRKKNYIGTRLTDGGSYIHYFGTLSKLLLLLSWYKYFTIYFPCTRSSIKDFISNSSGKGV